MNEYALCDGNRLWSNCNYLWYVYGVSWKGVKKLFHI